MVSTLKRTWLFLFYNPILFEHFSSLLWKNSLTLNHGVRVSEFTPINIPINMDFTFSLLELCISELITISRVISSWLYPCRSQIDENYNCVGLLNIDSYGVFCVNFLRRSSKFTFRVACISNSTKFDMVEKYRYIQLLKLYVGLRPLFW